MYERFTDRSRRVMQLANQEAQRWNHEAIGTEHILLGLIKEGSGVAANVLKNLEVDLRKVRIEVEKLVQPGPEMVTMGKLPHTPRAKKVIEFALEEARLNHDNHVGTEHLLLGLLREGGGIAAQVLMTLGVNLQQIRDEILALVGKKENPQVKQSPNPFEAMLQQAIDNVVVPSWLEAARDYHDGKRGLDKAKAARDLIEQLRGGYAEWRKTLLIDRLGECKQEITDIEKELGDAGNP